MHALTGGLELGVEKEAPVVVKGLTVGVLLNRGRDGNCLHSLDELHPLLLSDTLGNAMQVIPTLALGAPAWMQHHGKRVQKQCCALPPHASMRMRML